MANPLLAALPNWATAPLVSIPKLPAAGCAARSHAARAGLPLVDAHRIPPDPQLHPDLIKSLGVQSPVGFTYQAVDLATWVNPRLRNLGVPSGSHSSAVALGRLQGP